MIYKCINDVYYVEHLLIKKGKIIRDDYPIDAEGKYKSAVDIDFSMREYFIPCDKNVYNVDDMIIILRDNSNEQKCITEYGTIVDINFDNPNRIEYSVMVPALNNKVVSVDEFDIIRKTYRYYYINTDGYISDAIMYMDKRKDKLLKKTDLMFSNYEIAKKKLNEIMEE